MNSKQIISLSPTAKLNSKENFPKKKPKSSPKNNAQWIKKKTPSSQIRQDIFIKNLVQKIQKGNKQYTLEEIILMKKAAFCLKLFETYEVKGIDELKEKLKLDCQNSLPRIEVTNQFGKFTYNAEEGLKIFPH